jgi:hypothetical protein
MTRSDVLLHCPDENMVAARHLARGIFLPIVFEFSLVAQDWRAGSSVFLICQGLGEEDGSDTDESRAARMDGWVPWESRGSDREPD